MHLRFATHLNKQMTIGEQPEGHELYITALYSIWQYMTYNPITIHYKRSVRSNSIKWDCFSRMHITDTN
jgi:hypothetical protein